jgi:hypothetical protein
MTALTAAVAAYAAPPALNGSDTLEDIAKDVLSTNCGLGSSPSGAFGALSYVGGGSGTGQNEMVAAVTGNDFVGHQIVAPMSRAVNAAGCTSVTTGANARPASDVQGIVFALDGLNILGDTEETAACGNGHSAGAPAPKPVGYSYTDLTRTPDTLVDPTSGATVYSFADWKDVLKLLYLGIDNTGAKNCASAARQNLANNYKKLFKGGCLSGNCTSIKHAYRRGDLSGTTDTFLTLLSAPAIATVPFCNGTDQQDKDPIRIPCDPTEQVCEYDGTLGLVLPILVPTGAQIPASALVAGESEKSVLYNASTLPNNGDVAPFGSFLGALGTRCTSAPDTTMFPGFPNTPRCDCRYPVPGDFVVAGVSATPNLAFTWNARVGGQCKAVTHPLAVTGADPTPVRWGTLNGDDTATDNSPANWGATQVVGGKRRCCRLAGQFFPMDPRLMNLQLRNPQSIGIGVPPTRWEGKLLGGEGAGAANEAKFVTIAAFYRIHSDSRGQSAVPNRLSSPTFSLANGYAIDATRFTPGTQDCQLLDSTVQIGCLVQKAFSRAEPGAVAGVDTPFACSVGFAGREASDSPTGPLAEPFKVNNVDPTDQNIQNLVVPGASPTSIYPLARNLYLNTVVGFGNSPMTFPPPSAPGFTYSAPAAGNHNQAQYNFAKCFADPSGRVNAIKDIATKRGFVLLPAIPANGNTAGTPVMCTDMCTATVPCSAGALAPIGAVFNN